MAAVSNKKGVVGSKGRNMPIMPSMSEVVPTMVYSIFIGANIDQKTKKYSVLFILFFFISNVYHLKSTNSAVGYAFLSNTKRLSS